MARPITRKARLKFKVGDSMVGEWANDRNGFFLVGRSMNQKPWTQQDRRNGVWVRLGIEKRADLASAKLNPYSCIIRPMPIFEYQCSDCEAKFEKIVLSQSTDVQCPDCSSAHIEKLLSSFAVSTGSTRTSSAQSERSCGRGNFT